MLSNPLHLLAIMATFVVVLAIIVGLLKAKSANQDEKPGKSDAYELRKSAFTPAERSFAGVLDAALRGNKPDAGLKRGRNIVAIHHE